MSVIEGSILRRINSFQINRNLIRPDSGVGATDTSFSSIRRLKTLSFPQRVLSPDSGVRAPQDSIDFSKKAYDTGRSLTRGHRLGAADAKRWQYTIDSALKTASRRVAQRARAENLASMSKPLTSQQTSYAEFEPDIKSQSIQFGSAQKNSSPSIWSSRSIESPAIISWEGKQAVESYGFFSSLSVQSSSYTVEA
ncbi:MAG: hypothetical protein VYC39_03970 [Myxococcota bacterium]|nr:hypothetical protein [Myxococcota bacterium]